MIQAGWDRVIPYNKQTYDTARRNLGLPAISFLEEEIKNGLGLVVAKGESQVQAFLDKKKYQDASRIPKASIQA
jgi:DNA-binding transcriptional regulator LsrR (DeoR family)